MSEFTGDCKHWIKKKNRKAMFDIEDWTQGIFSIYFAVTYSVSRAACVLDKCIGHDGR